MASRTPRLRYHAVSVVSGPTACAAVKQLKNVRVLSAEAPRLPLANCDCPAACQCTYRHYDDRRAGPRRALDRGRLAGPWSATDRRRSTGRRDSD